MSKLNTPAQGDFGRLRREIAASARPASCAERKNTRWAVGCKRTRSVLAELVFDTGSHLDAEQVQGGEQGQEEGAGI